MIKSLNNVDILSEFVWMVYQDESKRTTPPFDSYEKTREHIARRSNYKTNQSLGLYRDDQLHGVVFIDAKHDEKFVSVQGPYIHNLEYYDELVSEVMDYLEINCKGCECYFGTTKTNLHSQKLLESRGYVCTDDTIQMSVTKESINELECMNNILALDKSRMEEYRKFHNTVYHDYYWSADRLYKVLGKWKIHIALMEDKIIGSVFTNATEVFGCHVVEPFRNKVILSELLYTSTKSWLDEGSEKILNFVPEGIDSESAGLVGYKGYDTYMCYHKELI